MTGRVVRGAWLALSMLGVACGDGAVASGEHDLAWLVDGDGEAELFDRPAGTRLDYEHGDTPEVMRLHADGSFELARRTCAGFGDYRVTGSWYAVSSNLVRLDADAEFGSVCCPRIALEVEPGENAGQATVHAIDAQGEGYAFGNEPLAWTIGRACLLGCCQIDGITCDPVVDVCDSGS